MQRFGKRGRHNAPTRRRRAAPQRRKPPSWVFIVHRFWRGRTVDAAPHLAKQIRPQDRDTTPQTDNQNYPADGSELNSVWRRLRAYLDRHGARIPSSVPFIPPPSPLLVHLRLRKNTKKPREKSIFFSSTNRHRCIFSAHQYCLSKSRSLQGVGGAKKLSHQPLGSWVRTTKIEENSKSQTKIKATDY